MGGGHGHDSHKPAGPYDVPHGPAYPSEARPFGLEPGAPSEGWEVITWGTYAVCSILLIFGISMKPDDDFKVS